MLFRSRVCARFGVIDDVGLNGVRHAATRRRQRLREPSGPGQQLFRLFRHLSLLQVLDAVARTRALRLPHCCEDAGLGYAAEIVADRRRPAGSDHVEIDRLSYAVGMGQGTRLAVVSLIDGIYRYRYRSVESRVGKECVSTCR